MIEYDAQRRRQYRFLIALMLLALIMRASWVLYFQQTWPEQAFTRDSPSYLQPARAMLSDHRFAVEPHSEQAMFIRTPGYPLFIASIFYVFGDTITWVLLAQVAVSVIVLFFVRNLGFALWSSKIGLLASALLTVEPLQLLATGRIMTECLHSLALTSMALIGAWALIRRNPSMTIWFFLGLITSISTHIRPTTYYFPIVVTFLILFHSYRNHISWKKIVFSIVLYLLPMVFLIGGWQLRNHLAVNSWNFSGIEDFGIYVYRAGSVVVQLEGISHREARQKLLREMKPEEGEPQGVFLKRMRAKGLRIILAHPKEFVISVMKGVVSQLFGMNRYININNTFAIITARVGLAMFYLLVLIGIAVSLDANNRLAHIYLISLVVYILIVSSDLAANARFRVPIMPIMCLYAAAGIQRVRHLDRPLFMPKMK